MTSCYGLVVITLLTTCYVQTISDFLEQFVTSLLGSSTLLQDNNNLFQTCLDDKLGDFHPFTCLSCLKQDELSDELSFLCPSSSRRAIHLSVVQIGLNNNFRVNKFPYQCYIIIKSPNTLSNTQYNLTHINYLSDHIFASPLVLRKLRSANLNLEVFHRHFYPPGFYQVRFHSWKF